MTAHTGYSVWRDRTPGGSFTDWLRECSEPDWTAAVTHPFAAGIVSGEADMRRYLVQDFQFVDSFTALLGAAVATAGSFEARVPYGRFIGQIATDEERGYFHRALRALGEDPAAAPAPEPVTAEFRALMDEVRTGQEYPMIVAVLCVAEWLYLGWAERAQAMPDSWIHREWIELHEGPDFRAWVGFLRGELDLAGPALPEAAQDRIRGAFRRAVSLERAFFDMAAG